MKKLLLLPLFIFSCGPETDTKYIQETVYETTIETIIRKENDYRLNLGQAPLTSGLVCTLYTVPNGSSGIVGTSLTNIATYTYIGSISQTDILPSALSSIYTSWYVIRCIGKVVILDSNYYKFGVNSDDGSLLYIDGSVLINNDGNHGSTFKSGTKLLKYGIHDIRLDYMQANGNQTLQLYYNDNILPANLLYH